MIKATVRGLDVVVHGLDQVPVEVREAAFYGVAEVLQKAYQACYHMLSEGDHSIKDLAEMGHPYSAAHGFQIHDPDELIHVHNNELRAGLDAIKPTASFGDIIDGKVVNNSEIDPLIQLGTLTMRARPYMEYVMKTYGDDFGDLLEARIQESLSRLRLAS